MATKKKSGGQKPKQGDSKTIEGTANEPAKKKKRTNPFTYLQQVRAEGTKVSWTSRNETMVSTVMVLIMVAIMAVFFFGVDQLLRLLICEVLPGVQCVAPS